MGFVVDIVEIVEIVVHLHRSELSFVNDVLVTQRADVEPLMKTNFMCALFAKHIKLSLEMLFIKVIGGFWGVP